jgi:hypothetical protein
MSRPPLLDAKAKGYLSWLGTAVIVVILLALLAAAFAVEIEAFVGWWSS